MKKQYVYFFSLILLTGNLLACKNDVLPTVATSSEIPESLPTPASIEAPSLTVAPSPINNQTWQLAYTELLRASGNEEFYLCDIDNDGVAELLTGGPEAEGAKHAYYDVYTYKNGTAENLGRIYTLSSEHGYLWLDGRDGILGYDYGSGSGEAYRYHIENNALVEDGEVYGYYYEGDSDEPEDNLVKWFIGTDGDKIIVTEETEHEYQTIQDRRIDLDSYHITEDNIAKVIYGEEYPVNDGTDKFFFQDMMQDNISYSIAE